MIFVSQRDEKLRIFVIPCTKATPLPLNKLVDASFSRIAQF